MDGPDPVEEPYDAEDAVRRRRRDATLAAALTAVVVAAVVAATGLLGPRDARTVLVAPHPTVTRSTGPSPSPTPGRRAVAAFRELTPEEVRRHPDAESSGRDLPTTGALGVRARIWSVCLDECTRATEHVPGELQRALEVSHDDVATSAVYALDLSESISHALDDWYLLDAPDGTELVNARGEWRPLTRGDPVAVTDIAGPLVHSIRGLAYVDLEAGELHAIEGEGRWDWQGAADTWFWGTAWLVAGTTVTRHAALWRNPDGTFGVRVLPIGESRGSTGMLRSGQPGTLAVVEHFAAPRLAHVSTDHGATWQVRIVPDRVASGGRLPDDWQAWPAP